MAVGFIAGITANIMNSKLGIKRLMYLTDQGIIFLALHFLIDAGIVTARWTWERFKPGNCCKSLNKCILQTELSRFKVGRIRFDLLVLANTSLHCKFCMCQNIISSRCNYIGPG